MASRSTGNTKNSARNTGNSGEEKVNSYFRFQTGRLYAAKASLAKYIVNKYLLPGDSIVIDAGTSLSPIASAISDLDKTSHSIMTHNYEAFNILQKSLRKGKLKGLNLFFTGGRYDDDLNAFFGEQTCKAYESFGPQKVFIGVSGLSCAGGLRCRGNTEEKQVKEVITKLPAQHRIIIADFIKFGKVDALQFAKMQELKVALSFDNPSGASEPNKVKVSVVTNKPDEISYMAHVIWLKEKFKIKDNYPLPSFHDLEKIYNSEVESLRGLDIEVDEVDFSLSGAGHAGFKYSKADMDKNIQKFKKLEIPQKLLNGH